MCREISLSYSARGPCGCFENTAAIIMQLELGESPFNNDRANIKCTTTIRTYVIKQLVGIEMKGLSPRLVPTGLLFASG